MDIKVAIFEDNRLILDALKAILDSTDGFRCTGIFANCNNLDRDIQLSSAHVILMDIEMPGLTGIEATRLIRERYPSIKVLIQTVFNDNDKIFNALCAGASGYILKSDPPAKLLEALAEVYNGGAAMSPGIAQKVLTFFVQKNVMLVPPEATNYDLSPREKEILSYMLAGFNFKAIASKMFISYETVRSHVKRIYKKLHVVSKAEAVLKATQQGFR